MLSCLGIAHHLLTAFWLVVNGTTEHQNRNLLHNLLVRMVRMVLLTYLLAYGSTLDPFTGELYGKSYFGKKRWSLPSTISPGELVLMQNQRQNKLSTKFHPEPVMVSECHGEAVKVHTPEGSQISTVHDKEENYHQHLQSLSLSAQNVQIFKWSWRVCHILLMTYSLIIHSIHRQCHFPWCFLLQRLNFL